MTKIAAIIGGVLLMAGVAMAGTVSSLGSSGDRTIGSTLPTASVTARQDDRAREREVRGRERELRGRAAEAREDLRGPCDEAEHATDARCTATATAPATTTVRTDDDHHGRNRGPGGDDDGGHRGHGVHGGDD